MVSWCPSIFINHSDWIIQTIRIRTDRVIFLTQWVYPVPSADKGVILPCTVVVGVQSMHGVKLFAVVLVVLQVRVGVSCLLRERSAESSLYNKRHNKGNSIHTEEKAIRTVWWRDWFLLCSCGAEIMENHQDNLWSLSALKYFWLEEPEIIKKILNGFLPVRAQKRFVLFDWFVFVNKNLCLSVLSVGNNPGNSCSKKYMNTVLKQTWFMSPDDKNVLFWAFC